MARPRKQGLDYFPHDTDASSDEKIEALRAIFGNDGYAFYFIMLERMYRSPSISVDVSTAEKRQILSRKVGVKVDLFDAMIAFACDPDRNIFDSKRYELKQELTSNGARKRAKPVIEKRKKSRSEYKDKREDSAAETQQKPSRNPAETGQSKGKKSKVNNTLVGTQSFRLSELLFSLILRNNPNAKKPNLEKWAQTVDRMIRLDKRDPQEIEAVIRWCQDDDFWYSNILSTEKLRKQYDQLCLKMGREKVKGCKLSDSHHRYAYLDHHLEECGCPDCLKVLENRGNK